MPASDLTKKQEAFAVKFVECGNASEAYRHAYDVSEKTLDTTVWVEACMLRQHPKVSQRIANLIELRDLMSNVTASSIMQELEEVRKLALQDEQYAVARGCSMDKAKMQGLVTDKKEVNVNVSHEDRLIGVQNKLRERKQPTKH